MKLKKTSHESLAAAVPSSGGVWAFQPHVGHGYFWSGRKKGQLCSAMLRFSAGHTVGPHLSAVSKGYAEHTMAVRSTH